MGRGTPPFSHGGGGSPLQPLSGPIPFHPGVPNDLRFFLKKNYGLQQLQAASFPSTPTGNIIHHHAVMRFGGTLETNPTPLSLYFIDNRLNPLNCPVSTTLAHQLDSTLHLRGFSSFTLPNKDIIFQFVFAMFILFKSSLLGQPFVGLNLVEQPLYRPKIIIWLSHPNAHLEFHCF